MSLACNYSFRCFSSADPQNQYINPNSIDLRLKKMIFCDLTCSSLLIIKSSVSHYLPVSSLPIICQLSSPLPIIFQLVLCQLFANYPVHGVQPLHSFSLSSFLFLLFFYCAPFVGKIFDAVSLCIPPSLLR